MDIENARAALARFVRTAAQARDVRVDSVAHLAGGAIQQNWGAQVEIESGPFEGTHAVVIRRDAPSAIVESHSRAQEFEILKLAFEAGVRVPEPLWLCEDESVLDRPFYVARRVPGVAAGHRLVRDLPPGEPRERLLAELGQELARIHALPPARLPFLSEPRPGPARALVARYRHYLDLLPDAHPALEWGLRWCEVNAPPRRETVLVHRDYRTGNYLVEDGRLSAVLDWEFTGCGDPIEDVAWFCARCWRFGAHEREAGGIGPRAPFYRAYEAASGRHIDAAVVTYWEIMAHIRWAVIALHQAERHASGAERSLELALTGRIAAQCELEILLMTDQAEGGKA